MLNEKTPKVTSTFNPSTPHFIPHPSQEAYESLSAYITAALNGMENARHPETTHLDIVVMRFSRTPQTNN